MHASRASLLASSLVLVVTACGDSPQDVEPTPVLACGGSECEPPPPGDPPPTPKDDGGTANDANDAPSATDGVKNGGETDVDCGGPDAATPRCAVGKKCGLATDCVSKHCSEAKKICELLAPSCTGAAGTVSCGAKGDENCCTTLPVPGGSFNRFDNPQFPATVSSFKLDKFEITVGRMRAFLDAKNGNPRAAPPAVGAGAHPKIANSGWRASFDVRLPNDWAEINARLGAAGCENGGDNTDGGAATWTAQPGPYESLPITCLDWYTFFAFCAWDGGRLPTNAEWNYAASGGDEQREFAWSAKGDPWYTNWVWGLHNDLVAGSLWDAPNQVFKHSVGTPFRTQDPVTGKVIDGPAHIAVPGAKKGIGKWGHADLSGNLLEYLLDGGPMTSTPQPGACTDCAFIEWPDPPQTASGTYPPSWWTGDPMNPTWVDGWRYLRGGSVDAAHPVNIGHAYFYRISRSYYAAGARCARD